MFARFDQFNDAWRVAWNADAGTTTQGQEVTVAWENFPQPSFANDLPETITGTNDPDTLEGLGGSDTLSGLGGADSLLGGDGPDSLSGGDSNDTLIGGAGNDTLAGNNQADTYVYSPGDGNDIIRNTEAWNRNGSDTLVLQGFDPEDVSFSRVSYSTSSAEFNDLLITFDGQAGSIRVVDGMIADNDYMLQTVEFGILGAEDNPSLDYIAIFAAVVAATPATSGDDVLRGSDVADTMDGQGGNDVLSGYLSADLMIGGAGDDSLSGSDGNDTLEGGSGDDTLSGNNQADTYVYSAGDGHDVIRNEEAWNRNGSDVLVLQGMEATDVQFSRVSYSTSSGEFNDLLITFAGIDGSIKVVDGLIADNDFMLQSVEIGTLGDANNTVLSFSDVFTAVAGATSGTSEADTLYGTDIADTLSSQGGPDYISGLAGADVIQGGDGDDSLTGGDGNDTLEGGLGDDTLTGSNQADTYVYTLGDGTDVIRNEETWNRNGADTLVLQGVDVADVQFSRAAYVTSSPGFNDLLITFNGADGSITVVDGMIVDDDFMLQSVEIGTLGGETNISLSFTDIFTAVAEATPGTSGADTLQGSNIADTLDGLDGADALFGRAGNDIITGGTGDDSISGGDGNDTMEGGLGDDTLLGNNQADTYIYSLGDGNDVIRNEETWNRNGADRLVLQGIDQADVVFSRASDYTGAAEYNDLLITFAGLVGSITVVDGMTADDDFMLHAIEFGTFGEEGNPELSFTEIFAAVVASDPVLVEGTSGPETLTGQEADEVLTGLAGADLITGGEGDDSLIGGDSADTLRGEAGDDTMVGNNQQDTYVYAAGDGDDVIKNVESRFNQGNDRLVIEGIQQEDVIFQRLSITGGAPEFDDLLITFDGIDGSIIVQDGMRASGEYLLHSVEFGTLGATDNPLLDFREIFTAVKDTTPATAGDDLLYGAEYEDTLSGLDGNDTISGQSSNDSIDGGADDDYITGNSGNDTLRGGTGDDTLLGGDQTDTYVYALGDGVDLIRNVEGRFAQGNDRLVIEGIAFEDTNFQRLSTLPGTREFEDLLITFDGSDGRITVEDGMINNGEYLLHTIEFGTLGAEDNLILGYVDVWSAVVASVAATGGNDSLVGAEAADVMDGLGGDDTLLGQSGNDTLLGNSGADRLEGNSGSDTLTGGTGDDTLLGGDQADTYVYALGDGDDLIQNVEGRFGQGNDRLIIEGITREDTFFQRLAYVPGAREFDDLLITFSGSDGSIIVQDGLINNGEYLLHFVEFGSLGADDNLVLTHPEVFQAVTAFTPPTSGDDSLLGAEAGDVMTGLGGDDTLGGYGGADDLDGGTGNDRIEGNSGNDTLTGGRDNDTLIGGDQADIYVYTLGDGDDLIQNVEGRFGQGSDRLVLQGIGLDETLFQRVSYQPAAAEFDDLLLTFTTGAGSILVENGLRDSGEYYLHAIEFGILGDENNPELTAAGVFEKIAEVNVTPTARDDAFTLKYNTTYVVAPENGILLNDTDGDNNPLSAVLIDGPAFGQLTLDADGGFTYTPNADYVGTDSFTYVADDARDVSDLATVTLTVRGNDNPVGVNDAYSVDEDATLTITAPGPLANDFDVDLADTLSISGIARAAYHGDATLTPTGTLIYTPDENFAGQDSIIYRVIDDKGGADLATIVITVNPLGDAPEPQDDTGETTETYLLTVSAEDGVLTNDSDPDDGDTLSVVGVAGGAVDAEVTLASGAVVTMAADGSYTYDPGAVFGLGFGETATDSFDVTVADQDGQNATSTVEILIQSAVSAPDLAVTTAGFTGGETGNWVSLDYSVENAGAGPAVGPWTDTLYLSADTVLDEGDTLLRTVLIDGPLLGGESYSRTVVAELPGTPGNFYLLVDTDSSDAVLEGDEANTGRSAATATITANYAVSLDTDVALVKAGGKVPLSGLATRSDGTPAAFEFVTIESEIDGSVSRSTALTDANGLWSTTLTTLQGVGGPLSLNARHPDNPVEDAAPEASVDVIGMTFDAAPFIQEIIFGQTASIDLTLENFGDLDLTGLTTSIEGLPESWTGDLVLDSTTLAGNGAVTATLEISVPPSTVYDFRDLTLRVESAEGADASLLVRGDAVVSTADIELETNSLRDFMLRGDQKLISLDVTNEGSSISGPISVILPDIPWLSLVTPGVIGELAPDETAEITLALTPDAEIDLIEYTGTFVVAEAGGQTEAVDFSFSAIEDDTGTLLVRAEDEYTYFTADNPALGGASVVVTNAVTGAAFFGNTGETGTATFEDLPEGYYNIRVSAPSHREVNKIVYVNAGDTNESTAFLSYESVSYSWSVTEIEIEDRYEIDIEAEFETDVPVPVVVIDPPVIDLALVSDVGNVMIVPLSVTNHGFIAVNDVDLGFGTHPLYDIDVPQGAFDRLGAKETIVVEVTVTRTADLPEPDAAAGIDGLIPQAANDVPCNLYGRLEWSYPCGPNDVSKGTTIGFINVTGNCGDPADPFGGGGGGGGGGIGSGSTPIASTFDICDFCEDRTEFPPICIPGASTNVGAFLCGVNIGKNIAEDASFAGYVETGIGCIPVVGDVLCAIQWGVYIGCLATGAGGGGGGGFAAPFDEEDHAHNHDNGHDHGALPQSATSAGLAQDYTDAFAYAETMGEYYIAFFGDPKWITIDADDTAIQPFFDALAERMEGGYRITEAELDDLLSMARPKALDEIDIVSFAARWNATLEAWDAGISDPDALPAGSYADIINFDQIAEIASRLVTQGEALEAKDERSLDDFINDSIYDYGQELIENAGGVCATVRIKISQEAVMTRQGFEATLEITNEVDQDLTDLFVEIEIRDDTGQLVESNVFGVYDPVLNGLTAIDGSGVLAGGEDGSAVFTFIPSRLAAQDEDTSYFVTGSFGYTDGTGAAVSIPLRQEEIVVRPQAALELDYFLSRDVISDDPFTNDVIEETEPFNLGLMVSNVGAGTANNLTIASAQPEIIENEKGLLIDFAIIGSSVNGAETAPSLTVDFGDVEGGDREIANWVMTSSLQGKFIDAEVTFSHINELGIEELSLITETRIHELTRMVVDDRTGADDLPDFLVNDDGDATGIPDALYTTDGDILDVAAVFNATAADPVSTDGGETSVTATLGLGWHYLQVDDPSLPGFKVTSVIRDSDGKSLLSENFWQTEKTFPANGRPIEEPLLHIFDYVTTAGSETYTVTYTTDNVGPVAQDDTATTVEDNDVVIDVLINDSDPDGDPNTAVSIGSFDQGTNGTVLAGEDGMLIYRPDLGFVGSDSFAYTIVDADAATATAMVTVDVTEGTPVPTSVRIGVTAQSPDMGGDLSGTASFAAEGNTGSEEIWFVVTREGSARGPLAVSLERFGNADDDDITADIPPSVTLADGQTQAFIPITVIGNLLSETDKTVGVRILGTSHPEVTIIADADEAVHTIENDDTADSVIEGTPASETLAGDAGRNWIIGKEGADDLEGKTGADTMEGGSGEDRFIGTAAELDGDRFVDFTEEDVIAFDGAPSPGGAVDVFANYTMLHLDTDRDGAMDASIRLDGAFADRVFEVTRTDAGSEIRLADPGATQLSAFGERLVTRDEGPNVIYGDAGDDFVLSSGGPDRVSGGDGSDVLVAGAGNDTLAGGNGNDLLTGLGGKDIFIFDITEFESFSVDTITDFTPGEDAIRLTGGALTAISEITGAVIISFGSGIIRLDGLTTEDLNEDDIVGGARAAFALSGTSAVHVLTDAADRFVTTDSGPNRVYAQEGNDTILTAEGDDVIDAGAGSDFILAGGGNDTLVGGQGNDVLNGGGDADRFVFEAGETGFVVDTITDFEIGTDVVELIGYGALQSILTLQGNAAAQLSATEFLVFEGVTEATLAAAEDDVFEFV